MKNKSIVNEGGLVICGEARFIRHHYNLTNDQMAITMVEQTSQKHQKINKNVMILFNLYNRLT